MMTKIIQTMAAIAVLASSTWAQDHTSKTGFDFLKRFEGHWKLESRAPGQSAPMATGTFMARTLGNNWLVCEQHADMGATKMNAFQRVGYDSKTQRYIGTWFDNMLDHVWNYDGELDASGNILTLNAQGPDWQNPSQTKDYRDIYEFKSDTRIETTSQVKNDQDQWETFMTGSMTKTDSTETESRAKTTITPFLMFTGNGLEAIDHYKTVFPDLTVLDMNKYGAGESGKEGTIKVADISIAGQQIRVIDSPAVHDFDFTPSFSFFVECENEKQLTDRFTKLSDGGKVMMPLGNYGFSKKFGWTADKFGVSWQLNLK